MARFQATQPNGVAVQQLEGLVRTAVFRSARDVVAYLLQQAAERIDAAYQPKPGWQRKARAQLTLDCIFGFFTLERDYYYHPGKQQGHYPADAALGLEGSCTPALARLVCLEGADEASYQKAQEHLQETGGIKVSARQIQRLVQGVGPDAQIWQEREALIPLPGTQPASIMYLSGDASGVPMRPEELEGRQGKGPDGKAKTRMANLGCVFTQHQVDDEGHPIRDPNSTTYVSTMGPIGGVRPAVAPGGHPPGPVFGRLRDNAHRWRRRVGQHGAALFSRRSPNRGLLSRDGARPQGAGGPAGQQGTSRF